MKKKLSILIPVVLAVSCGPAKLVPFNPLDGVVVSDTTVDRMAHCSVFKQIGKDVYIAYYHDTTQIFEHPQNPTIQPVLAKTKAPFDGPVERKGAVSSGETYGSFTQYAKRAPYDPNVLHIGDKLYYYFNGCVDGSVVYSVRVYDLLTESFEPEAHPCTISWHGRTVDMSSANMMAIMSEMGFQTRDVNDLTMSSRFIRYRGEYYNVFSSAFTDLSKPLVVKTADGLHFDLVFACAENPGGTCEAAIEIMDDELYIISRTYVAWDGLYGMYIGKYSMKDGSCIVKPYRLTNQAAKGAIIARHGHIYAVFNVLPNVPLGDNVFSGRSRIRVARFDRNCNQVDFADSHSAFGVHYPYVDLIDGKVWMSYTEDRRRISPHDHNRSNISMIQLKL